MSMNLWDEVNKTIAPEPLIGYDLDRAWRDANQMFEQRLANQQPKQRQEEPQQRMNPLLRAAVGVFEPLMFAGDVTKATIYGFATGGFSGALEYGGRAISKIGEYVPGGAIPKSLVSGEDLARLAMGDNFDRMSPLGKWATTFFAEIATDPLTVIGGINLIAKAGGRALAGVGAGMGAGAVREAGEAVVRFADGTIGRLDFLAQRALNPYAIAAEGVKKATKVATAAAGVSYDDFVGRVVNGILDIPIPFYREIPRFAKPIVGKEGEEFVPLPQGVPLTIGDIFYPRRFRAVQELTGSPQTGPSVYAKSYSTAQNQVDIAREHIIAFNSLLTDAFGVESSVLGIFKKKLPHPKAEPIIHEVLRRISNVVDNYGVDARSAALNQHYEEIMRLVPKVLGDQAAVYGITPDSIKRVLYDGEEIARNATLAITYQLTGFNKFTETVASVADELGLDKGELLKAFSVRVANGLGLAKRVGGLEDLPRAMAGGEPLFVEQITEDALYPGIAKSLPKELKFDRKRINAFWGEKAPWASTVAADILDIVPMEQYLLPSGVLTGVYKRTAPPKPYRGGNNIANAISELATVSSGSDLSNFILKLNEVAARIDDVGLLANVTSEEARGAVWLAQAKWYEARGAVNEASKAYASAVQHLSEDSAGYFFATNKARMLDPEVRLRNFNLEDGLGLLAKKENPNYLTGSDISGFLRYISRVPRQVLTEALKKSGKESFWGNLVRGALFGKGENLVEAYQHVVRYGVGDAIDAFEQVVRRVNPRAISILTEAGIKPVSHQAKIDAALDMAWARFQENFPYWPKEITPDKWIGNVLDGYMRRVLMAKRSVVTGLETMRKGRYVVLPEIAGERLDEMQARLVEAGLSDDEASHVIKELQALDINGHRLVGLDTVAGILKNVGFAVEGDPVKASLSVMRALGIDKEQTAMIDRIVQMAQRRTGNRADLRIPKAFAQRQEATDIQELLDFANPLVSIGDLALRGAKMVRSNEVLYGVYNALREAESRDGIRFIHDTVPPKDIRHFVQVPNNPDAYGPFASKWIPESLAIDLYRELSTSSNKSFFTRFISLVRGNFLNWYDSTARNFVGNILLLQQSVGTNFTGQVVGAMPRIMRELARFNLTGEKGLLLKEIPAEWLRDIAKSGITQDIYNQLEDSMMSLDRHLSTADKILDAFKRWTIDLSQNINIRGFPVGPLGLFTMVDNALRIGTYIVGRDRGMSGQEALWLAQNALGNYTEIPRMLQVLRDTGLVPFGTFMVLAMGRTAKSMLEAPKYPVSIAHLQESSWASTSPSERARAEVAMQSWLRASFPVALPFKLEDGSLAVAPLINMLPYASDSEDLLRSLFGGGILGIMADIYVASLGGGQAMLGKEFGRGTVFDPHDTALTKVAKTAAYTFNVLGPAFMTRGTGTPGDWLAYSQLDKNSTSYLRPNPAPLVKTLMTYTHPDLVKQLERIYVRDYDSTPAELVTRTLGVPVREMDVRGLAIAQLARSLEAEIDSISQYYRNQLIANRDPVVQDKIKQRMATDLNPLRERLMQIRAAMLVKDK